ncbi:hypothetical protein FRC02_008690 [Tulasnella sp. 418]|nr:hypothetical protein FRC02_008690 [Tulasnella sp. 418]
MTPGQRHTPAAVDIGAGSGQWAIEFAREFPHATVVGIDLVPPAPNQMIPPNCRFEVDDVNLPLYHYEKAFNVCHMRSIDHGITDYEGLIHSVAQILRTNGVLLMVSGDNQLFSENRTPMPTNVQEGQPGWCATQALFIAAQRTAHARGAASEARYKWQEWLLASPYYTSAGVEDIYIPIGPWMNGLDNRCIYIAQLMQMTAKRILSAFKPMLLANGYNSEVLDAWIGMAVKEVTQMNPRLFARWRFAWAVRNSTPWTERAP